MKNRIKAVVIVIIASMFLALSSYVNTYYHALESVTVEIQQEQYIDDNLLIFGSKEAKTGMIFYPGGKVECEAYVPLMKACAKKDIFCVLIRMPANLAVFNVDAANGIQDLFPNIKEWYIAGHSLGGAMAASYVAEHKSVYEGIILLAAYSTVDLSGLRVLSIYGSEDLVLNREKCREYSSNLPESAMETVIDGGNHAYFGSYGEQEGDGNAQLSDKEQQKITANEIEKFIKNKVEKN